MKKHEEKQEEKVVENEAENEHVPVEEKEPEPISYKDDKLQGIENERQAFLKTFRLNNTFKWVVFLVCIAAFVVALLVIPNIIKDNNNLKVGLMSGIAVGALAIMVAYSVITKRTMNKRMRKYFTFYYRSVNEFALGQEGFSNMVLQEPGKIDLEFFKDTNLYKDVIEVGSRGLTEFEYNGIPMRIVDCAGKVKQERRIAPIFVGKLLHCATKYLGSQSIVIYFKGNEKALPPTNVSELKVIEDNAKYIIYSNSEEAKKVINAEIKKMLNEIEMNEYLIDLAISMHDGKIFVCFGYDDPLMILPLYNQFDPKPNETFKKDLGQVIKLVEALNK